MRRRIDTSGIEFRVASMPLARTVSRQDKTQKVTRDGRPVWVVKLTAFDPGWGRMARRSRSGWRSRVLSRRW